MIKAILVDDEPDAIRGLELMLSEFCNDVAVIATANSVNEAEKAIQRNSPDILFLDITLGNATGFDLLKRVGTGNFLTIFATAHDHFALKAIKFNALDFLVKPIEVSDLIASVNRAKQRLSETLFIDYGLLLEHLKHGVPERLEVPTRHGVRFIDFEDIECIEANGNYSAITLRNEKPLVVTRQLGSFESALPSDSFVRIHKSYIINLGALAAFDRIDGGVAELSSGKRLEVSKKYKPGLLHYMKRKTASL